MKKFIKKNDCNIIVALIVFFGIMSILAICAVGMPKSEVKTFIGITWLISIPLPFIFMFGIMEFLDD